MENLFSDTALEVFGITPGLPHESSAVDDDETPQRHLVAPNNVYLIYLNVLYIHTYIIMNGTKLFKLRLYNSIDTKVVLL